MIAISYSKFFELIGVSSGLALSVFVLIALALRIREIGSAPMYLWSMVVFFTINACDTLNMLLFSDVFEAPLALFGWQNLLIPGFMISLYFYVRGLTSPNPRIERRDLIHLLPFCLAGICLAPMLIQPGAVRAGKMVSEASALHQTLIDAGDAAFWILWIIVILIYGILCVGRLIKHKRNIRKLFSDLKGKDLFWLDVLVYTILTLAGIVVIDEIFALSGADQIRSGYTAMMFDIILAASFGLIALRASPPMPNWSNDVIVEETNRPTTARPYARSGLTQSDLERYAKRLQSKMMEGQLWRNHSLNLRGLAKEVSLPAIHLSEVLNTHLRTSFYDYVSQHRIREACQLLAVKERSILEISDIVGFNAKSTFNTSFKKMTGQTPTEWRANQGSPKT